MDKSTTVFAPRFVILDLDETLGSFGILYSLLTHLNYFKADTKEFLKEIPSFADWLETHNVFRPGTRTFLKTLWQLKQEDKLDYVFIYTNQSGPKSTPLDSLCPFLLHCIEYFVGGPLIDLAFVRDPKNDQDKGPFPKKMERILEAFSVPSIIIFLPDNCLIFDDYAKNITWNGKSLTDEPYVEALSPVTPYYRRMSNFEDYEELIDMSIEIIDIITMDYYPSVTAQYRRRMPSKDMSRTDELFLTESVPALLSKFREPSQSLNPKPQLVLDLPFTLTHDKAREFYETGQIQGRESEGDNLSTQAVEGSGTLNT